MSFDHDGEEQDVTVRRWATTSLAMIGIGLGLVALAPTPSALQGVLADPQRLVDTQGPDALLVLLAWVLAAGCWVWGAVGLLLTVAGTGTGIPGRVARCLLTVVLPAGARRAAALAVGLSLTAVPVSAGLTVPTHPGAAPVAGPVVVSTAGTETPGSRAATPAGLDLAARVDGAPDWSTGVPDQLPSGHLSPAPDWPGGPDDARVVLRGDCLWDIAAAWLTDLSPADPPGDAAVAEAVRSWWETNAAVIGPDPDRLLPGQVLRPPAVT